VLDVHPATTKMAVRRSRRNQPLCAQFFCAPIETMASGLFGPLGRDALKTGDWAKLRSIAPDLVVDDSVRSIAGNLRALPLRRRLRNEAAGNLLVSVYEYGPGHELRLGYRRDDGKLRLVAVASFGW
jgi:hypothetical protein